uniref:hypothetical protein n=1 Tax=Staphylococcus shinii TaxID=2912228 RepID=UPI003F544C26
NGYSDNILVKLFISEIVHTEDSFLLKLYYKFNFATEPSIFYISGKIGLCYEHISHSSLTVSTNLSKNNMH